MAPDWDIFDKVILPSAILLVSMALSAISALPTAFATICKFENVPLTSPPDVLLTTISSLASVSPVELIIPDEIDIPVPALYSVFASTDGDHALPFHFKT